MYREEKAVLLSKVEYHGGVESNFFHLPTNGTYIRGFRGDVVGRYDRKDRGIFYVAECEGGSFQGNITDTILCERITEYFASLYGQRYTNCAAMAHYLTTGEFVECVEGDGMAVVHQGMRPYDMASRVDVGDMVGIVYGNPRTIGSRKLPEFRKKFRKATKRRVKSGTFTSSVPMVQKSLTAEEVRTMCKCPSSTDYHFMVCVDHYRSKPVWISQYGHFVPGTPNIAVVLTLGEYDPYQQHTPLFSLIKKRR